MKRSLLIILLLIATVLIILFSLGMGAIDISFKTVIKCLLASFGIGSLTEEEDFLKSILFEIRIPRIIFCTCIGAILGVTGTAIQGIFRNPLAEPGLIGISAGASFFAALAIVFEIPIILFFGASLNLYIIAIAAFVGAVIAVVCVYNIASVNGKSHIATMILAGIAINALAGAATGLMTYVANEQQLRNITFWALGSMAGATWESAYVLLLFSFIGVLPLLTTGRGLNLFALGESQAEMMGLQTKRLKIIIIVFSTLAVGAAVSFAGVISFVGLLVPHVLRLIGSVDNRFLLPASLIGGALVLNVADLVARTIILPLELPIGVITALIGAPVFIIILIREKKKNLS